MVLDKNIIDRAFKKCNICVIEKRIVNRKDSEILNTQLRYIEKAKPVLLRKCENCYFEVNSSTNTKIKNAKRNNRKFNNRIIKCNVILGKTD